MGIRLKQSCAILHGIRVIALFAGLGTLSLGAALSQGSLDSAAGEPLWLQVYGWAAWSPQKAILTLRNPSAHAQEFTLDVAQALELPVGVARRFSAHSPWSADAAQPAIELEAAKPYTFHLAPLQVLTLEAVPQQ